MKKKKVSKWKRTSLEGYLTLEDGEGYGDYWVLDGVVLDGLNRDALTYFLDADENENGMWEPLELAYQEERKVRVHGVFVGNDHNRRFQVNRVELLEKAQY